MNKETLTALKGSIEKWEAIVAGTGVDEGAANCPLCQVFHSEDSCSECPTNCYYGAPYDEWEEHVSKHTSDINSEDEMKIYCPTCKKLAQAELEHLKSLLPGGGMRV